MGRGRERTGTRDLPPLAAAVARAYGPSGRGDGPLLIADCGDDLRLKVLDALRTTRPGRGGRDLERLARVAGKARAAGLVAANKKGARGAF